MTTWSFYDLATGLFIGRTRRGDRVGTVPTGCGYIAGFYDRLSQRVDLDTGQVITYERTQAEIAAARRDRERRVAVHRIAALEMAQQRPMRELALDPANADARQRLAAIDAAIAAARQRGA